MTSQAEHQLLLGAVAGERAPLERLLLTHHQRLLRYVEKSIPRDLFGEFSADDVLQMAYIDVFRHIRTFQPHGAEAFYRWLTTIAQHRLLDIIKLKKAAKRGGGQAAAEVRQNAASSSVANLLDLVAADEHTPSRSAVRHEAAAAVNVALAGLKDDYREALQLRYIEGRPVAEVATKMARTERAVHMLCYRGIRELRVALGRASDFLSSSS